MTTILETEGATRVGIRAQAYINQAYLRVIHTGVHEQIAVMTLPFDTELGEKVRPATDQLFLVVDGVGEARVGDCQLAVEAGDLIPVEAGTRYNIVNRATLPLRLITVFAPPVYAPGTIHETMEAHEPPVAEGWRPFP